MEATEMIVTDLRNNETQKQQDIQINVNHVASEHTETHTEKHAGPHIPLIQGEQVWGPISNTTITIFTFFIIVLVVSLLANRALHSPKKSRLRNFFLTFIKFFDEYLRDSFGDKVFARKHFVLVVGVFSIVFFGNILGLVIDWIGYSLTPSIFYYFRPMHSDLNTTGVLAMITVFMMLSISVKAQGPVGIMKSYLFNFRGHNFVEKCVNVFVGWLHFIGLGATFASLSLRLFGNIFAGVVLLGVITYLGGVATASMFEVGKLLAIPFWFFEVGVALIQAIVFAGLIIAFFNSAKAEHH